MTVRHNNWGWMGRAKRKSVEVPTKLVLLPPPDCPKKAKLVDEIVAKLEKRDRERNKI